MRSTRQLVVMLCLCFFVTATAEAQFKKNPLAKFATYRQIEADPNKIYELTETNGPWLILAASFAGDRAEEQAQQLVIEMRKRLKLTAYVFRKHYDFSDPILGRGLDKFGEPKRMKHQQGKAFDEIAVMIGDFPSLNDPSLQTTLKKIKYWRPSSLSVEDPTSTQRFAGLRAVHKKWHEVLTRDQAQATKGPLGHAFATRNPLLPQEYFRPTGFDSFVQKMNSGVKYSLLTCPAKFTVRVATFRGRVVIDPREVAKVERTGQMGKSRLAEAAEKAHFLTEELRKRGVEAYEFHDRNESIVTVGSFASVGQPRKDGKIEINPNVLKVMENYGARKTKDTIGGNKAMKPRSLSGIPFDIQPAPVEVPQRSIASDYMRSAIVR